MKDSRILPDVASDLADAADWYDREGYAGLGVRFLANFFTHLPALREHGEIHRRVYLEFRRALLKPFPYALYYRYHEDVLVVSLVIHCARSPLVTRRLLKERQSK